jgi:hypothetical protein
VRHSCLNIQMQVHDHDGLREHLVTKSGDMNVSEIIATATGILPTECSSAYLATCSGDDSKTLIITCLDNKYSV